MNVSNSKEIINNVNVSRQRPLCVEKNISIRLSTSYRLKSLQPNGKKILAPFTNKPIKEKQRSSELIENIFFPNFTKSISELIVVNGM